MIFQNRIKFSDYIITHLKTFLLFFRNNNWIIINE